MALQLLTGKQIETYVCKDGDNPIATLIEAVLQDSQRKRRILASGDPRAAIESIKKHIVIRQIGENHRRSWMYRCYVMQFDTYFRILSNSRMAEDRRYNPF